MILTRARISLMLIGVLSGAASPDRLAAQSASSEATARCLGASTMSEIAAAGEGCVPVWADSLRSAVAAQSSRARRALEVIGGRAAVDILRADFERAPNRASRRAVILAMGTTGSPEDVAFLISQLQGPFTGGSGEWFAIQLAATTLGLLRATAARDSLRAVLARNDERNTFAGSAIATALASLARPPCADSVSGDVERELIRIVIECRPQPMWTTYRYHDSTAGGIWIFERDAWRFDRGMPADTTMPRVSMRATIASEGRHAEVTISTWCGSLCGEGWTFRLIRTGPLWRVVSAVMNWVS